MRNSTFLKNLNYVVQLKFGSHIYGTSISTSDLDIKGIYLPKPRAILLQEVTPTFNLGTKLDAHQKNTSEDTDIEVFSLQQYLRLLMEGQTMALDILFTPAQFYLAAPHPIWTHIQENRSRFLHSGVTAFVGYSRQQAAKYGMKGNRIAAIRQVLDLLAQLEPLKRLIDYTENFESLVENYQDTSSGDRKELVQWIEIFDKNRNQSIRHLQICNRKLPVHATVKYAKQVLQKIFDEYGHRALAAENNEGVDWKALMHAVRIATQARELLETGQVSFPRPERSLLLQIRKGELPYPKVSALIEDGLSHLELASANSLLPKTPDFEFADNLVYECYREIILETS